MRCTICANPRRAEIDQHLLRAGTRPTSREFGVSLGALHRHTRHVTAKLSATPKDLLGRIESLAVSALGEKDTPTLRELRKCLELIGTQLHGKPERREEDLELAIARKIGEATLGFDPEEIARLKALVETANPLARIM
jgi:hypothetical protein